VTLPVARVLGRRPWFRPPPIVRRCSLCMRVLHDVDGGEDRLKIPRQAIRERTVCHGPLNWAEPGDPPRMICLTFDVRLG
jgi:hypothetical protein